MQCKRQLERSITYFILLSSVNIFETIYFFRLVLTGRKVSATVEDYIFDVESTVYVKSAMCSFCCLLLCVHCILGTMGVCLELCKLLICLHTIVTKIPVHLILT